MSIVSIGQNQSRGTQLPINQPKDTFGGSVGKETGRRVIRVDYDGTSTDWTSNIPATGSPHPAASWLKYDNYTLTQSNVIGNQADIVLNYKQDEFDPSSTDPPLPVDETVEDGNVIQIDIKKHPKFHTPNPGWAGLSIKDFYNPREQACFMGPEIPAEYIDEDGKTKPNPEAGAAVPEEIAGATSFVVGSGTVSVREYSYNEPGDTIPNAGLRAKPPGYGGTVDYWLVMSCTKSLSGVFWVKDTSYQYSGKKISGCLYDDLTP